MTGVFASVKNQQGEKLKLTLTNPSDGTQLAGPILIEWTGRLDLGSEIMGAKGSAASIVTVTMDDGLTGTLDKCNNWFSQFRPERVRRCLAGPRRNECGYLPEDL